MSARINAELKIELMSDLCSGSGYSYAGIIDSDICYDSYGIPYIPAKRIKGCLRETLETVLYTKYPDRADEIFGRGGSDRISDFVITDAVIEGYDELKAEIAQKLNDADKDIRELYGAQNILGRFTHVLGQTKIGKDGAAEDNSLRYTRVVNQFSPLKAKKENLMFYAKVSISDRDGHEKLMYDTVKATRHMGLKRNRGLGNVRCSLKNIRRQDESEKSLPPDGTSDKRKCISYTIRNTAPLMLSGTQEDTSRTYISGQSILGVLAGKYLSFQGKKAENPEFQTLFLKGEAQFANAYPYENGMTYYPAPLYINSLKKTKKYVNVIERKLPEESKESDFARDCCDDNQQKKPKISDPAYNPADGNQPKKLKGKYLSWDVQHVSEYEIAQDVVYHHRHDRESGGEVKEGILYSMEVICPDQCFRGMIAFPEKYGPVIKKLLQSGDFYFGKSRSAQYGRCVIEDIEDQKAAEAGESESRIEAGHHLVVTFLSDALFISERGEYTVYKDEIEKAVQNALGIKVQEEKEGHYLSSLQTTQATGYLGTWNLRRDAKPAIAAGSYLVYKLAEPFSTSNAPIFIGERTLEGYGQIRLDLAEDMDYLMWRDKHVHGEPDDRKENTNSNTSPEEKKETQEEIKHTSELANLMLDIIIDTWVEQMEYGYLKINDGRTQLSNTAIGRITLMLKESLEENKGRPPASALEDFAKRIESIKTDETRKTARGFLKQAAKEYKENKENKNKDRTVWELDFANKVLSGKLETKNTEDKTVERLDFVKRALLGKSEAKDEKKLPKELEAELKNRLDQKWGAYLMYILTEQKYNGGRK